MANIYDKYRYYLWIINFCIHMYHILHINQCTTFMTSSLLLISTCIIAIVCYHKEMMNQPIFIYLKVYLLNIFDINNRKMKHITMFNSPKFVSFTSYRYFHIDSRTCVTSIDEFIVETEKTRRYTFVIPNSLNIHEMFIQIQYIQETESLILTFNLSHNYPPLLLDKINKLFSFIFKTSNNVYVWGNIYNCLSLYKDFGLRFFDDTLSKAYLVDIQEQFKLWYNRTFSHDDICKQIVDFDDIDGPLCSCSFRPYKQYDAKWSLLYAIAYTFGQYAYLVNDCNNFQLPLAITVLAKAVQDEWTRKDIDTYRTAYQYYHKIQLMMK